MGRPTPPGLRQPGMRLAGAEPAAGEVSTSITGVLKATAGVISAATPGTDYVYPAGVAGGQTITGGTAAADGLTLRATANAAPTTASYVTVLRASGDTNTAPTVLALVHTTTGAATTNFGASQEWLLEDSAGALTSAGVQNIHWASASTTTARWSLTLRANGAMPATPHMSVLAGTSVTTANFREPTNTTASSVAWFLDVASASSLGLFGYGPTWTTSGDKWASGGRVTGPGAGGLALTAVNAAGMIRCYTGGTTDANERLRIAANGDVSAFSYFETGVQGGGLNTLTTFYAKGRSGNDRALMFSDSAVTGYAEIGFLSGNPFMGVFTAGKEFILTSAGQVQAARIVAGGSILLGASGEIATTATQGFPYVVTCDGPPTGVPDAYTGKVALIYDRTNNRLYAYNGAWRSAAFA